MTTTPTKPKASFEVNTTGTDTGPIHSQLVRLFNERHDALDRMDEYEMRRLDSIVPDLLNEFERTESHNSANAGWLQCKMRGGWHVAKGEYEEALAWETQGFNHAASEADQVQAARRKSVSASNIADQLTRLGRPEEALEWARISIDLWPTNAINHLVMAMALYRAGFHESAEHIIAELLALANFSNENDVLAKCISYERELHDMHDLPAVQKLLQAMESAGVA
jgi:tetratricopeptide (TPR) repeat protein